MTMSEGELAVAQLHFVRDRAIEPQPPPAAMTGAFGWVRANLFSTRFNVVLTILVVALLLWVIPALIKFLIIDAVWSGADRDACRELVQHREVGACWPFVWERLPYFIYGSYPIPERWRVDVFFAMLALGIVWLLWLDAPRRDLGSVYFFVVLPIFVLHPAARLCSARLAGGRHRAVGRRAGHHRGRLGRHRRVAAARHSAGARPAVGHADGAIVLGALHRVRARRAADHRAVHGERHAAAVRARAVRAGQIAARADRRRAVRLGLHGGGGARRPAGDPEGPVRGRHGARPALLADDAADRPAAGAEDHHSRTSSTPISACSRTRRWSSSSAFSISCTRSRSSRIDPKWAAPVTSTTGYAFAAMFYFVFCYAMSRYARAMEARLAAGDKR